jgi:FMN phosphatase YigB (HAD superfamily)
VSRQAAPELAVELEALFVDPSVRMLAIDLRGTLVGTPRITVLVPELMACGVPAGLAEEIQALFDAQLRTALAERHDVVDWTRFAAIWMAAKLASEHHRLDVEAMMDRFRARYVGEARRLVPSESLRRVSQAFAARCVIVADGPFEREAAVLTACFGEAEWMPPLVCSECLGINKLTPAFFARLGRHLGVPPSSTVVVGDRWDKDFLIPRQAGCHAVLVGDGGHDATYVESLEQLAAYVDVT